MDIAPDDIEAIAAEMAKAKGVRKLTDTDFKSLNDYIEMLSECYFASKRTFETFPSRGSEKRQLEKLLGSLRRYQVSLKGTDPTLIRRIAVSRILPLYIVKELLIAASGDNDDGNYVSLLRAAVEADLETYLKRDAPRGPNRNFPAINFIVGMANIYVSGRQKQKNWTWYEP